MKTKIIMIFLLLIGLFTSCSQPKEAPLSEEEQRAYVYILATQIYADNIARER